MFTIRRSALATIAGLIFVATTTSAAVASTDDFSPSFACSDRAKNIWKENCNGWVVKVINKTKLTFQPDQQNAISRASSIVPSTKTDIDENNYTEVARGEQYWVGGPSDITLTFETSHGGFGFRLISDWSGETCFATLYSRGVKISYDYTNGADKYCIDPAKPIRITVG